MKRRTMKSHGTRPYAERLAEQKLEQIANHRQDSAEVIIKLACITLNELEHYGFQRMARFSQALMENVVEFYNDRERMEHWVNKRLEDIGFEISKDGNVRAYVDETGRMVKKDAQTTKK